MSVPFRFPYRIALHDTDAAGVIFAPQLFRICHEAYEAMMAGIGFSIGSILVHRKFGLPVVHLEGEYHKPLTVGDPIDVQLTIASIGRTSYIVSYRWHMGEELAAEARTTHVCVDYQHLNPIPIPAELKAALSLYHVPA